MATLRGQCVHFVIMFAERCCSILSCCSPSGVVVFCACGEFHIRHCFFRKVYSGFNTVFLSLLLLAAGVGFLATCF